MMEERCQKPEEYPVGVHSRVERSWDNEPWLSENDTAKMWGEIQTAPTPQLATSAPTQVDPLGTFHQSESLLEAGECRSILSLERLTTMNSVFTYCRKQIITGTLNDLSLIN